MMSVLTVVVLIGLQGFPDLHAKAVMAAEQQEELKGGSLIATAAPAQIVKEDETENRTTGRTEKRRCSN